jgi:hypothetical protein
MPPALSNLLSGLLAFGWAASQSCLLGQKNGESIGVAEMKADVRPWPSEKKEHK